MDSTSPATDVAATAAVDVVIVNHNAGESLERAVASALAEGAHHVHVVDNASTDASLQALRAAKHPRVSVHDVGFNSGFAAACNRGLALCTAPFVLFLNPDGVLGPGALAHLLDALHGPGRVGMAGGRLCDPDGREQRGSRRLFPTPERTLAAWRGADGFQVHEAPLPDAPVDVEAISGACMLVRRQAIDECGGWDEGYFLHCEDLDWCRQFAARGWRVVFVPDALVFHEKGVSSRARPVWVEWHKHRGMQRFFLKWQARERAWPVRVAVLAGIWTRFGAVAGLALVNRALGRADGDA